MLIDTREQRPLPPLPEPRRPRLHRFLPIPIGFILLGVAAMVPPLPAYLLILGAIAIIARTFARVIPSSNGLEEHRQ